MFVGVPFESGFCITHRVIAHRAGEVSQQEAFVVAQCPVRLETGRTRHLQPGAGSYNNYSMILLNIYVISGSHTGQKTSKKLLI